MNLLKFPFLVLHYLRSQLIWLFKNSISKKECLRCIRRSGYLWRKPLLHWNVLRSSSGIKIRRRWNPLDIWFWWSKRKIVSFDFGCKEIWWIGSKLLAPQYSVFHSWNAFSGSKLDDKWLKNNNVIEIEKLYIDSKMKIRPKCKWRYMIT